MKTFYGINLKEAGMHILPNGIAISPGKSYTLEDHEIPESLRSKNPDEISKPKNKTKRK